MKNKDMETTDEEITLAVQSAFEKVIKMAEEEPQVTLELNVSALENEETAREIADWLFKERR